MEALEEMGRRVVEKANNQYLSHPWKVRELEEKELEEKC